MRILTILGLTAGTIALVYGIGECSRPADTVIPPEVTRRHEVYPKYRVTIVVPTPTATVTEYR